MSKFLKEVEMTPQVDSDGLFTSKSIGSSGTLTLDGALVSNGEADLTAAHRLEITSTGDDTGLTFTVNGEDNLGRSIQGFASGSNSSSSTVFTYFKKVTSISVDGASAGNVSIGTTTDCVTPWLLLNPNRIYVQDGLAIKLGGVSEYSVHGCLDPVVSPVDQSEDFFVLPNLFEVTFSNIIVNEIPLTGVRLQCTSHTSGNMKLKIL